MARKAITDSLENRMIGWRYNEPMLLATALGPRYKLEKFGDQSIADEVKNLLRERSYDIAEQLHEGQPP